MEARHSFALMGAGFLVALGFIKSWGILVSVHWAIYATVLGIGGLVSGTTSH